MKIPLLVSWVVDASYNCITHLVSHCNTVSTLHVCVCVSYQLGMMFYLRKPCHMSAVNMHRAHTDMSLCGDIILCLSHCLLFLSLYLVAKRKAIESALSSQFYLLIQQFAVNSEKVARILYGISVIDIVDLGIATTNALTEMERATVLAITLVRRLRRWPDLFGDVCKVLSDIPSMQEANGTYVCQACCVCIHVLL